MTIDAYYFSELIPVTSFNFEEHLKLNRL